MPWVLRSRFRSRIEPQGGRALARLRTRVCAKVSRSRAFAPAPLALSRSCAPRGTSANFRRTTAIEGPRGQRAGSTAQPFPSRAFSRSRAIALSPGGLPPVRGTIVPLASKRVRVPHRVLRGTGTHRPGVLSPNCPARSHPGLTKTPVRFRLRRRRPAGDQTMGWRIEQPPSTASRDRHPELVQPLFPAVLLCALAARICS